MMNGFNDFDTQVEKKVYNVLIIDDNNEIHSILKLAFDFWGFNTYSAFDAYEGLAFAVKYQPVIILLDIDMPEINGEKTLKLLKSIEVTRDLPVFILSGILDKKVIFNSLKLGAKDFLTKPFSHELLLDRISGYLPIEIKNNLNMKIGRSKRMQ